LGQVEFEYDARRRPFRRTQDGMVHTAFLDPDNRFERMIDPRGNVTQFTFDGLDRCTVSRDAVGNVVRHHFDAAGNRTLMEEDEVDPDGGIRTYHTSFVYDARNRPVSLTDPLGNVTATEFDGRELPVAFVTPAGLRVEHRHDLDGNIVRRSVVSADPVTHQWERDLLGQITRYVDPEGAVTSFAYTRHSQLASITFADASRWQCSYKPGTGAMLDREITPAGTAVQYEYGPDGIVGRLTFSPVRECQRRAISSSRMMASGARSG
jgi:YD repeat-containing protein